MAKIQKTKEQTVVHKALHRNLQIAQHWSPPWWTYASED